MGDKNLHAAWDHMLFTQHVTIKRPIPVDYWTTFVASSDAILASSIDVVSDPATYENMDVASWAKESYNIAIVSYEGLVEGEYIPQWYIDANLPIT